MGTKTLLLALILLVPTVVETAAQMNEIGRAENCDPVHLYTNPPNATVEPDCIFILTESTEYLSADATDERSNDTTGTCDPIHIYTNPPNATVEPECVPQGYAEESK